MSQANDRTRRGPTDEVGSEGGSPGETDIDKDADILTGTEQTQSVVSKREHTEEHDHQLERDGRPAPRP